MIQSMTSQQALHTVFALRSNWCLSETTLIEEIVFNVSNESEKMLGHFSTQQNKKC